MNKINKTVLNGCTATILSSLCFINATPAHAEIELLSAYPEVAFDHSPTISGNGSRIAFATQSDELENNLFFDWDIFLQRSGSLSLVTNSGFTQSADIPSISQNGQYLVFATNTSLVSEDTNSFYDIYRYNISTGNTRLVSVSDNEELGTSDSGVPGFSDTLGARFTGKRGTNQAISANGRYVVFTSNAPFDPDDHSNPPQTDTDIYLRDMDAGRTTLISRNIRGEKVVDMAARHPSISIDNNACYIAFESDVSLTHDQNDFATYFSAFLYNRCSNTLIDLGGGSSPDSNRNYGGIAFSNTAAFFQARSDGILVPFQTWSQFTKLYRYDLSSGAKTIIQETNADIHGASASEDGRYVSYLTTGSIIPGLSTGNFRQLYIHDLQTGEVELVTRGTDGNAANGDNGRTWANPQMSADGCSIVFTSEASNLTAGSVSSYQYYRADNLLKPYFECNRPSPTPVPTATPLPTPTPVVTPTAAPTPTPSPTPTSTPTVTPTPSPSPTAVPVPDVSLILDNDDPGASPESAWIPIDIPILFFIPGPGQNWVLDSVLSGYYDDNYHYLEGSLNDGELQFIWCFTVPETGVYRVEGRWPVNMDSSPNANYQIETAFGTQEVIAQQNVNGGQWVMFGDYNFNAGQTYRILLSAPEGETVIADAIRLTK